MRMHRLEICRELGIDVPATLLNVDKERAREIALEENLSRRPMTRDQKKEIAYQLRNEWGYTNERIAASLCVSHVTVGNWLGPAKNGSKRKKEQEVYKFFKSRCKNIAKVRALVEEAMPAICMMEENLRIEAELGIKYLKEELLSLNNLLTEATIKLKESQQENENAKIANHSDANIEEDWIVEKIA